MTMYALTERGADAAGRGGRGPAAGALMGHAASQLGTALGNALLMAWEVWWALVLGFAVSAIVQAWVPRERVEARLAGGGAGPLAWATGLGAASSSCSYAATAIAKSLFQKGASAMPRSRSSLPHQPGVGARAGDLGLDRLAVHARPVPRRVRDDRADGGDAAAVHLAAARVRGARARAPPTPATSTTAAGQRWLARAPDLHSAGPTSLTTFAATGRCSGRRSPSASCSPAYRPAPDGFFKLFLTPAARPLHAIENVLVGPLIAVLELRLLGRERAAGSGAVVGRDLLCGRDRVHLCRPDRAADHRHLPQVLRGTSRCGSRRSCS